MSCFDFMADGHIRPSDLNWMRLAARKRGKAGSATEMTDLRRALVRMDGRCVADGCFLPVAEEQGAGCWKAV